jgi:BlaI family transcriptional regulator, penicillinase repressor
MKAEPRISVAEWEVMKVVWKRTSCSARQVVGDLASSSDWSPATVKTLLNRLLGKGVLEFKKNGKSYLYSPLWTEEQCRKVEAESFLDRVFDGALSPMLAHFVRSRRLGKKELDELERILRENK